MNTNHNRIKIADLETNEPNKTLVTNDNGELTFNDIPEKNFKTVNGESLIGDGDIVIGGGSQSLQEVLNTGNQVVNSTMTFYGSRPQNYLQTTASGVLIGEETGISSQLNPYEVSIQDYLNNRASLTSNKLTFWKNWTAGVQVVAPSNPTSLNIQTLQDKSGTIALLSDITGGGSQNLQQVLDTGNTASNKNIVLTETSSGSSATYGSGFSVIQNANSSVYTNGNGIDITGTDNTISRLRNNSLQFQVSGSGTTLQRTPTTGIYSLFLPAKNGTLTTADDFKTINGESIVGSGDIVISGGGSQTLDQVLTTGNRAIGSNIILSGDAGATYGTILESGARIQVYGPQGDNNLVSYMLPHRWRFEASGPLGNYRGDIQPPNPIPYGENGIFRLPSKGNGDFTFATTSDLNIDNVLSNGNVATDKFFRINDIASDGSSSSFYTTGFYTTDNSTKNSVTINSSGQIVITKTPGTTEIQTIEPGKVMYANSIHGLPNPITFNFPINKTPDFYTLATTSDFKTINGHSIVGTGDIAVSGEIPTLQQVLEAGNIGNEEILLHKANIEGVVVEKGDDNSLYRKNEISKLTLSSLIVSMDDKLNPAHFMSEFRPNYIQNFKTNPDNSGNTITMDSEGFSHSYFNGNTTTTGVLSVKRDITNTNTVTNLNFPLKDGTFTIATTDDISLKSYTVSTLPAATTGDRAFVTDAKTPTYLGALTGGGSVVCPVFYNGTAWVSH